MASFDIVDYSGEKIHQLDLRGEDPSNEDEILDAIQEMEDAVTSQPENSVLALTMVKDMSYNKDILSALKRLTKNDEPHVDKSAVVGVEGLQNVALQGVKRFSGRDFEIFDTEKEAREYLTG